MASVNAAIVEGRLLPATFRGRVTRGVSMKTKVVLRGHYQTHIEHDGSFEFPDVAIGTYVLEVESPHLVYSRVRVIVTSSEVIAMRMSIGDHFSSRDSVLVMPLVLRPRPRPMHYIPSEGQKVVGWFGNPMILMATFSLMMLLIMPRIMANLDADTLDALRSSYDFASLPSLPPRQMSMMANSPHHIHAQSSFSSQNLHSMDSTILFDQQHNPYSEEKNIDFSESTADLGSQWTHQLASAGNANAPVQTKKQK
ncbi:hypothetical protein FBU30_008797 [Linnemannia zychae]|nr:hypothetical protein FBU30_008797 [Linnemannia zychae]